MKYLVVIEKGEGNFSAYSPDVPGCVATGRSVEATLNEMRDALSFHIDGMLENHETIPTPRSLTSHLNDTEEISVDNILTTVEIEMPELAAA